MKVSKKQIAFNEIKLTVKFIKHYKKLLGKEEGIEKVLANHQWHLKNQKEFYRAGKY